jgi:hypothetical protein
MATQTAAPSLEVVSRSKRKIQDFYGEKAVSNMRSLVARSKERRKAIEDLVLAKEGTLCPDQLSEEGRNLLEKHMCVEALFSQGLTDLEKHMRHRRRFSQPHLMANPVNASPRMPQTARARESRPRQTAKSGGGGGSADDPGGDSDPSGDRPDSGGEKTKGPRLCGGCHRDLDKLGITTKWCDDTGACRNWRKRHPNGEVRPIADADEFGAHRSGVDEDVFSKLRRDWELACVRRLPDHSGPAKKAAFEAAKAEAASRLNRLARIPDTESRIHFLSGMDAGPGMQFALDGPVYRNSPFVAAPLDAHGSGDAVSINRGVVGVLA